MTRPIRRRAVFPLVLLASTLLVPPTCSAQTSLQIPLQFDFLNPGAKSKAMAGAFVGVADDATATFANPAGLVLITRPELSVEGRHSRVETLFLERGRLSGEITNEETDIVRGPVFGRSIGSDGGAAFVSGVYTRSSGRWSVAGYRHELVRVDQRFLSNGVFQKAPEEFTSRRDTPQEGMRTVSVTGYGMTGAYRLGRETSVGIGLAVYSFDLNSRFRRFDTVGFLGPPNLTVELGNSSQAGDDTSVAPTVGALYGLSTRARVGVMYRHGPSFTFRTKDGTDPERQARFRVPDTLAVGASFRPVSVVTVAMEVTRVQYSRLRRDFVTDQARAVKRESDFDIPNGTEVHIGAQYLPTISYGAPKLRAGVWYDPDHSVQFAATAASTTITDRLFDERLSAALSTGKSLVHFTGGVGFSVSPRLEVNGGVDVTSRSRAISASFVVR
jgi:long-subunit fatty acid transport protein